MIKDFLKNKPAPERATIKGGEIAKLKIPKGKRGDLEIEIVDLQPVSNGVVAFVKAWKNGNPIGFGDGSVEIEKITIINPPILVEDVKGDIIQSWVDFDGKPHSRKLREDPKEALLQSLEHTIGLIGKDGSNIISGKVGQSTLTAYSNAGGDGSVTASDPVFSTVRSASSGGSSDPSVASTVTQCSLYLGTYYVQRTFWPFDSSSLGSSATISSATFSLYGTTTTADADSVSIGVIQTTQTDPTSLAVGDYDNLTLNSPTEGATRISAASWNTAAYNDFALNASGLSWIDKTGYTKLGCRISRDIDNSAPTGLNQMYEYTADQTGTTNDPKLVVTYSTTSIKDIISEGFIAFPR